MNRKHFVALFTATAISLATITPAAAHDHHHHGGGLLRVALGIATLPVRAAGGVVVAPCPIYRQQVYYSQPPVYYPAPQPVYYPQPIYQQPVYAYPQPQPVYAYPPGAYGYP